MPNSRLPKLVVSMVFYAKGHTSTFKVGGRTAKGGGCLSQPCRRLSLLGLCACLCRCVVASALRFDTRAQQLAFLFVSGRTAEGGEGQLWLALPQAQPTGRDCMYSA